jgi:hypothetical protein
MLKIGEGRGKAFNPDNLPSHMPPAVVTNSLGTNVRTKVLMSSG